MQSISQLLASDNGSIFEGEGILHPKQYLYELTGGIVSVKVFREDDSNQRRLLSQPFSLGSTTAGDGGSRFVGTVICKGILLAAVAENSREKAVNVCCELAVKVLKDSPHILSQLARLGGVAVS